MCYHHKCGWSYKIRWRKAEVSILIRLITVPRSFQLRVCPTHFTFQGRETIQQSPYLVNVLHNLQRCAALYAELGCSLVQVTTSDALLFGLDCDRRSDFLAFACFTEKLDYHYVLGIFNFKVRNSCELLVRDRARNGDACFVGNVHRVHCWC